MAYKSLMGCKFCVVTTRRVCRSICRVSLIPGNAARIAVFVPSKTNWHFVIDDCIMRSHVFADSSSQDIWPNAEHFFFGLLADQCRVQHYDVGYMGCIAYVSVISLWHCLYLGLLTICPQSVQSTKTSWLLYCSWEGRGVMIWSRPNCGGIGEGLDRVTSFSHFTIFWVSCYRSLASIQRNHNNEREETLTDVNCGTFVPTKLSGTPVVIRLLRRRQPQHQI